MEEKRRCYFYGVWDESEGHFMHEPGGRRIVNGFEGMPCQPNPDGCFLRRPEKPYEPQLWHTDGWTVLTMWDYSADTRPGSNATFFVEGHLSSAACWFAISEAFPSITRRIHAALAAERKAEDRLVGADYAFQALLGSS